MAEVQSLGKIAKTELIHSLGKIAAEQFTCGGTVTTPPEVRVAYLDKDGQWNGVTFPGLQDADFLKIIESSSVGIGKETVINEICKDAYALEPEKFISSFQLSDCGILGDVRVSLVPDVLNIRAELYKMNVYSGPTGCFKAHVDTPRGGNMFGSLVVCLPSQFTGGSLVTRHQGQEVTYDWSSPTNDPEKNIQWAAFFSDVEREILPVTNGYRVTLTYNLYHCDQLNPVPSLNITTTLFYQNLKVAIGQPYFMRKGGVLGFCCKHPYVFEEFGKSKEPKALLKGSDRMVMLAATALGLKVAVKPIIKTYDNLYHFQFHFSYPDYVIYDESEKDYFESCGYKEAKNITWCQKFKQMVPGDGITYYDYKRPRTDILFMAATILVSVPRWSKRSSLDGSDTDGEHVMMDQDDKNSDDQDSEEDDDSNKPRKIIRLSHQCLLESLDDDCAFPCPW